MRPALLTRMSVGPSAASAAATAAFTSRPLSHVAGDPGGARRGPRRLPARGRDRDPRGHSRTRAVERAGHGQADTRVLPVTNGGTAGRSMVSLLTGSAIEEPLHFIRRSQRDRRRTGHDPLEQAGENVPRSDLDEGCAGRERGRRAHALDPAHGRRELVEQESLGVHAQCGPLRRSRWRSRGMRDRRMWLRRAHRAAHRRRAPSAASETRRSP